MEYRTFGRLDYRPSALGFGAMRLPTIDGDPARIDEDLATQMIRTAIDGGVNYVDTAWPYHREQSEPFVGRALSDGYRARVKLATKLPSWLVETTDDFDRYLDEQLKRLRTERVDFYLLHGLGAERWHALRDLGILARAEQAVADGRIGHLGFSFHDDYPVFEEIVDAYDWTFCQIMYNYMDVDFQAGTRGLRHAAGRGLAVVVMEPLRGGQLTRTPPQEVERIWTSAPVRRTPADWALQWVWHHPEVSVVLSGMSTMEHVIENLESAKRASVGALTPEELAVVHRVREAYRSLSPIPCTDCKYCLPCPSGVAIPRIFGIYNDLRMYEDLGRAQFSYNRMLPTEERADRCVACGTCEAVCPQQIGIIDWLRASHEALVEPT